MLRHGIVPDCTDCGFGVSVVVMVLRFHELERCAMAKTQRAKYERALGAWEFPQRIELLRNTWLMAFPAQDDDIRPLARKGPAAAIMTALGWTNDYTMGVLRQWKSRHAYAYAVLRHSYHINIDGSLSEARVSDLDREQARQQLARPEPVPKPAERPPASPSAAPTTPTVDRKAEHLRGRKASSQHIPALSEKWPAAFPADNRKVRSLAKATMPIAEAMGWTPAFTHGVLMAWKSRVAYCNAVLRYNERINLDGSPSGVMVDDAARAMATQQLAMIAARKATKQAKEAAWAAQNPPAAESTPEPTPILVAPPEPEPQVEVIETPEQLRAHLRASLLKRREPPVSARAAP
jgi:sRNA-binding protein